MHAKSLQSCPTLCDSMDYSPLGISRQEYWCGLPRPPPGDLPNPGIEPVSLALAGRFFTTESPGKQLGKSWVQISATYVAGRGTLGKLLKSQASVAWRTGENTVC